MTETALSRSIQLTLKRFGIWCIRVQSGVIPVEGRYIHCAEPGTPDLCLPCLGWIETKTEGGKLNAKQRAWHRKAQRLGVNVGVARTVSEALAVVRVWQGQRQSRLPASSRG